MVSLGPGDSQLITLKALNCLKKSSVICVPTKSKNSFEKSLTYKIIQDIFKENSFSKKLIPIYSPMQFKKEDWQYQVDILQNAVNKHKIVSFVTLGDAGVYSTIYYLLDIIKNSNLKLYNNTQVIPGITSFSDASAKIKEPLCLGDSGFIVKPLLDKKIDYTSIYLRPKIDFSPLSIEENGKFYTFENLNFNSEKITSGKIDRVKNYMTLFIDFIKKQT
jgi:precorrin-2/cobalt-factor-2 C20-methyltransferase